MNDIPAHYDGGPVKKMCTGYLDDDAAGDVLVTVPAEHIRHILHFRKLLDEQPAITEITIKASENEVTLTIPALHCIEPTFEFEPSEIVCVITREYVLWEANSDAEERLLTSPVRYHELTVTDIPEDVEPEKA